MTTNRSSEELQMRELIVPELRHRYPTARIIHELPLRYSTNRIGRMTARTHSPRLAIIPRRQARGQRQVPFHSGLRPMVPLFTGIK